MTFEELNEMNDPCKECPLNETEYCNRRACMEDEPPCAWAEGDIDEWIADVEDNKRRLDEAEDRRTREQERRAEIARKRAETENRMQLFCKEEIGAVKALKKQYDELKKIIDYAIRYAEATNFANEAFGYKERIRVKPEIMVELEELKARLMEAQQKYEEKRKYFYRLKERKGE